MFNFWKPSLTDYFIAQIKQQGGLLINLASSEMKDLVDWGKVTREVKVITPEFQVYKNGKPATVVIYTRDVPGRNDPLYPEEPPGRCRKS